MNEEDQILRLVITPLNKNHIHVRQDHCRRISNPRQLSLTGHLLQRWTLWDSTTTWPTTLPNGKRGLTRHQPLTLQPRQTLPTKTLPLPRLPQCVTQINHLIRSRNLQGLLDLIQSHNPHRDRSLLLNQTHPITVQRKLRTLLLISLLLRLHRQRSLHPLWPLSILQLKCRNRPLQISRSPLQELSSVLVHLAQWHRLWGRLWSTTPPYVPQWLRLRILSCIQSDSIL